MVLINDKYTQASITRLQQQLPDHKIVLDLNTTDENLAVAEALLIRSKTIINESFIKKAPKLKVIITSTSGFDHISLMFCKKNNIQVMYTPEANVESVAELTISLMVQLSRRLPAANNIVSKFRWKNELSKGKELNQSTLGIIGFGRIGKRVSQLAQCFGMKVIAYDPHLEEEEFSDLKVKRMGLTELFRSCDFLSLHIPLTDETQRMINAKTLAMISSDAYLINTSRGKVVDEVDLASALKNQQLAGAALDVFQREPLTRENPLRALNTLILTPHIGAYTEQAYEKASMQAANQLIEFYKHEKISNSLV